MAVREQMPDPAREKTTTGEFGLQWNKLMGQFAQVIGLVNDIHDRYADMNVIAIGHLEPSFIGKGEEREMVGWQIAIPGRKADAALVPYDEVYYLNTIPTAIGGVPMRKLIAQNVLIEGYPFKAKTRMGIGSPIGPNPTPTWQAVLASLPAGRPAPRRVLLVGDAGAGKTTFAATLPAPVGFIDIWGGTQVVTLKEGVHAVCPRSVDKVFKVMLKLRANPTVEALAL